MPNIVNRLSVQEFDRAIEGMGSCIVVTFDKMTVLQASQLRQQMRAADVRLKVVKNRLVTQALTARGFEIPQLTGKCGVVFASEENAITAAKLVREFATQNKDMSIAVLAGIVEGEVISGVDAVAIADMPDKNTVRSQLAGVISGPARALATVISAVPTGLARCLQQRADGEGGGTPVDAPAESAKAPADAPAPEADAPKADAPEADAPKADAPEADASEADASEADAPEDKASE